MAEKICSVSGLRFRSAGSWRKRFSWKASAVLHRRRKSDYARTGRASSSWCYSDSPLMTSSAPVLLCTRACTVYNTSRIERTTRTLYIVQYTTPVTVPGQRTLESYAGLFSEAFARCGRVLDTRAPPQPPLLRLARRAASSPNSNEPRYLALHERCIATWDLPAVQ